ncbi:MAG: site-2 protease family protein [Nitrospirae bacterium]|nr:site-2 protease family protein [Nitrospirota bacterium]
MDYIQLIRSLTVAALPILVSITFHEVAHGWVAYKLGDDTAKVSGRLTLNPLAHIDLMGTVVMPIILFILSRGSFIFGSAKPVPVNFSNLKNYRRDTALVAAAGPMTNVLLSVASILLTVIVVRFFPGSYESGSTSSLVMLPVMEMLKYSIYFNFFLAAFNLIPVPPLDGGRIVVSLLPYRQAYQYSKIEPYGIFIVLLLWVTGLAEYVLMPLKLLIHFIIDLFLIPFGGLL